MTSTWGGSAVSWDATLTCWDVAVLLGVSVGQVLRMAVTGELLATVAWPGVYRFRLIDMETYRKADR